MEQPLEALLAQIVRQEETAYDQITRRGPRATDSLQQLEAARAWGRLQMARELLARVEAHAQRTSVPAAFTEAWDV